MDIKQFKLSSGEEILAEVIEYPEEHEKEIAVRNVMKLHMMVLPNGEYNSYIKPWFFDQEYNSYTLLNSFQLTGLTQPSNDIKEDYLKVVRKLKTVYEGKDLDEEEQEDEAFSDEDLMEFLEAKRNNRFN